jgi:hypothetical protein
MSGQAWPLDAALPQLAMALDATAMAPLFGDLLRGGPATLQHCDVDRVKYRPGRNVSVSYCLALADAQGTFTQRVAARFCSAGAAAGRHAKALTRPLQPTRAGPALSHLPVLDMTAHWWPNDAKLAASTVLAHDAALAQRWLPPVLRAAGAPAYARHALTLAQVVPEHRVTARVQIYTQGGDDPVVVYAKADAEARGAVTQAVMHSLWHSPARRAGRLALPQPLLWQPGSGLHWQAAVPGLALLDVPAQCAAAVGPWPAVLPGGRAGQLDGAPTGPQMNASMAAQIGAQMGAQMGAHIGAQVAALHHSPAPAAPLQTADWLRRQLALVHGGLGLVRPELRARLLRLAQALEAGLLDAPAVVGTLHGDLHPRNVLVDGERITLIDLDSARQGLVVLELGSCCMATTRRPPRPQAGLFCRATARPVVPAAAQATWPGPRPGNCFASDCGAAWST